MNKIEKFIAYINEQTEDKYNFLQLKNISYEKSKNLCSVSFIYPECKFFNDADREKVTDVIKSYMKIDCRVEVKINKSYVEPDLVENQIIKFLQNNYPMFYNSFNKRNLQVVCGNEKTSIKFILEKPLMEYFSKYNIDREINDFLCKNFCASFDISYDEGMSSSVKTDLLNDRQAVLRAKSDMDAMLMSAQNRYMVTDKKALVGEEVSISPRYIKSIDRNYDVCAVAGKVSFLTERTFKSKFPKKTKTGEEIFEEKPYFSFQIKDDTSSIYAVIFPSKANYHKMHLISNGDSVIVEGKIQKFNERYEIMAKAISLCKIPSKREIEKVSDQNLITDYRYIRPQKYTAERQVNLFDNGKNYSKEVMNGTFVVYDFETTGVNTEHDEIIEIGALRVENGEFKEVFSTLVKPRKLIPPDATRINRITNDMVANSFSIEQVIRDFYLFCKGAQMVGYNSIAFDKIFLDNAAKKVGITFENEQLDAFLMAKQKLGGLRNYKLGTVASYLEVNLVDAHRALNDVLATAEVFMKLY